MSSDLDDDKASVPGKPMRVERLLANLGYATRKGCQSMIKKGRVLGAGGGKLKVGDKVHHHDVTVDGEPLDPPYPLTVILNKPVGYVSTSPEDKGVVDPTIYDLLPQRYGARKPFLSSVGRLDKDTSGLLLLTDDGQLLHRIKSPKQSIWKVYEARLAHPLSPEEAVKVAKRFASGVLLLPGELQPLLPAKLFMKDSQTAVVSIVEGRYHQVRRMFTAIGNEVVTLDRLSLGGLTLPTDIARGEYRTITEAELQRVFDGRTPQAEPPASDDQADDTQPTLDQTPTGSMTPSNPADRNCAQDTPGSRHGGEGSSGGREGLTGADEPPEPPGGGDDGDDGEDGSGSDPERGGAVPAARRLRRVNAFRRRVRSSSDSDILTVTS